MQDVKDYARNRNFCYASVVHLVIVPTSVNFSNCTFPQLINYKLEDTNLLNDTLSFFNMLYIAK